MADHRGPSRGSGRRGRRGGAARACASRFVSPAQLSPGSGGLQNLTGFTLEPREVPVLPAPRPAVVLIPTDRRERLAACAARSFRDGIATAGGVQALAVTLPVLPLGECEAVTAPTRSAHPETIGASRKRQAAWSRRTWYTASPPPERSVPLRPEATDASTLNNRGSRPSHATVALMEGSSDSAGSAMVRAPGPAAEPNS